MVLFICFPSCRCQRKCDEFEKHNVSLISQSKALKEDKYDISEFLKHSRIERKRKVGELAEKLENQQQVAEQFLKDLKLQQSLQIEELKEQVDIRTSETRRQAAQIEEQKEQKEQLRKQLSEQLYDLESLEQQPFKEKTEHEAAIGILRSEEKTETNRLLEKTSTALNDRLERKTSEIIQEEKALHSERMQQLQVIMDEINALLEERDRLQSHETHLGLQIDDMNEAAVRIERDISTNEKTAERLTEVCQQLKLKMEDYSLITEVRLPQIEDLRKCLASASEERRQMAAMAVQLEAELQRERRRGEQLEVDMKEAVVILRHILTVTTLKPDHKMFGRLGQKSAVF
ncbi:cilia- and flagella-associated protein 157-like [Labrus bergylta]|uniref:cilia- and flagella-associated protein 157-like n=1 Tax=Labrus bergylta TaxID=56723 RepID=UPI00331351FE